MKASNRVLLSTIAPQGARNVAALGRKFRVSCLVRPLAPGRRPAETTRPYGRSRLRRRGTELIAPEPPYKSRIREGMLARLLH